MSLNLIGLCLIASLLTSCTYKQVSEHVRLTDEIVDKFVDDVQNKYHLACEMTGGGFMDCVREVDLSFVAAGPMTIVELRTLIVQLADEFLYRINRDTEIRQYLIQYPFLPENIGFSIRLLDPDNGLQMIENSGSSKELVSGVLLLNGKLYYVIKNEMQIPLQVILKETYEEAYNLAKQNSK